MVDLSVLKEEAHTLIPARYEEGFELHEAHDLFAHLFSIALRVETCQRVSLRFVRRYDREAGKAPQVEPGVAHD